MSIGLNKMQGQCHGIWDAFPSWPHLWLDTALCPAWRARSHDSNAARRKIFGFNFPSGYKN